MAPSKEQRAAIEAENHTILVSAAAGSGKTYVLVERILRLLRQGAKLDRMLIMTFTDAAAAEMRVRLSRRLRDEGMYAALEVLEYTQISTIHSFCNVLLKRYFQEAGLGPRFRVADSAEISTLQRECYRLAVNELLGDPAQEDFRALAEAFEGRGLEDEAMAFYSFLRSMPDPFGWLDRQIAEAQTRPYRETGWYQELWRAAGLKLSGMQACLAAQEAMFHEQFAYDLFWDKWQEDVDTVQWMADAYQEGPDALREAMAQRDFSLRLPPLARGSGDEVKAWRERYAALRKEMKDLRKDIQHQLFFDEEMFHVEHSSDLRLQRGMRDLMRTFHALYSERKRQRDVIEFTDMEQMAWSILQNPELRAQVQDSYDHLFVDECQDISAIQDSIIQQAHGENSCLFMVGDVKQSIYRFRLADPTLFLERLRTFSDAEDARERRIFLSTNYRSTAAVLEAVNDVFSRAMDRRVSELDYTPRDALHPGPQAERGEPVEVHLLPTEPEEDEEELTAAAREARVIIKEIRRLLETPHSVERDGEVTAAPYRYRDMVILLPKLQGVGKRIADELEKAGIPVCLDERGGYFQVLEVQRMLALLSLLDNPLQDEPLLTVCAMPPFQFTREEMGRIRLCDMGRDVPFHEAFRKCMEGDEPVSRRCREMAEKLDAWRLLRETMSLSDLLRRLLRETGYYLQCGTLPNGDLRQANLRLLCQVAQDYERRSPGDISGFLGMAEEMRKRGEGNSARAFGEGQNAVRITTMHKSKGLEYPVCFLALISARQSGGRHPKGFWHKELGLTFPFVHTGYGIERHTVVVEAIENRRRLDELAEKVRLLYVAMTRAQERLFLIGSPKESDVAGWAFPLTPYRIQEAKSMLNWVMGAVGQNPGPSWVIREASPLLDQAVLAEREPVDLRQAVAEALQGDDLYEFPVEKPFEPIPLKTSVTSLAKHRISADAEEEEETAESKRQPEHITHPLRLADLPDRPAFLQTKKITQADLGTQTHRLLSILDLDALKAPGADQGAIIRGTLAHMRDTGMMLPEEADGVRTDWLERFFHSEVATRMLRSAHIRREWPFNLRLHQGTLLQGVIDCAFVEDGQWVILDYKTDWIDSEEAFLLRYTEQLNWYRTAVEIITGTRVKEMLLYSLRLGKSYTVDHQEIEV